MITIRIAALAGACAALAACAAGGVTNDSGDDGLANALALAEANGDAADAQLAVLRAAATDGELAYQDYRAAVMATLACLSDHGIDVLGPTTDESQGYPRLNYAAGVGQALGEVVRVTNADGTVTERVVTNAEADPKALVADECRNRNSAYVELAYTSQASSIAAQDAVLETHRASVISCARAHGWTIDERAPIREMLDGLLPYLPDALVCLDGIDEF